MKFLRLASSLLAAASAPAAVLAATTTPVSEPVVALTTPLRIEKGMTREKVTAVFGAPSAVLSASVWVYFNFKSVSVPQAANYDTMVLTFQEDRVVEIRFCDSKPVRAFLARQEKSKSAAAKFAAQ